MTVHPRLNVTRAAEGLDRRRFTVSEIETMVAVGLLADERNELIGGELVPMSPKGNRHEVLKTELNLRWCRAAPETCSLTPETTFRLSDDTYVEPDFVIYDRSTKLTALSGGNVLLVVEISDSSLRYDTGRKAAIYASFGVRELWVIDAGRRTIQVFHDPAADGYRQTRVLDPNDVATPLVAPQAFALRLDDLDLA